MSDGKILDETKSIVYDIDIINQVYQDPMWNMHIQFAGNGMVIPVFS